MSTPTVSASRVILALRLPVVFWDGHDSVATSTELPFDERSYCSVMRCGATHRSRSLEPPAKTSSMLLECGVIEGAVTRVDCGLARAADAAIGLPLRTPLKSVIPPLIRCRAGVVNTYVAGSVAPAIL
jgi:hypothetical protein